MENFGDVGSLEDNVESFLSQDGDGNMYGSLKQTLSDHKPETSKGGLQSLVCAHVGSVFLRSTVVSGKMFFNALYLHFRFFLWRGWLYTDKK